MTAIIIFTLCNVLLKSDIFVIVRLHATTKLYGTVHQMVPMSFPTEFSLDKSTLLLIVLVKVKARRRCISS